MEPRRFGRCFEFDQANQGTAEQRQAVRDALIYPFGTKYDRLNHRLARKVKAPPPLGLGRIVKVSFVDLSTGWKLGSAGTYYIQLHYQLVPSVIKNLTLHELGHVVHENEVFPAHAMGWFAEQTGSTSFSKETFADAFRDWVLSDGQVWASLTPWLLAD